MNQNKCPFIGYTRKLFRMVEVKMCRRLLWWQKCVINIVQEDINIHPHGQSMLFKSSEDDLNQV